MSAPMVRATLRDEDPKMQTRRVVKGDITTIGSMDYLNGQPLEGCRATLHQCPYGVPGDRLWVREAWRAAAYYDRQPPREIGGHVTYVADETNGALPGSGRYRHARFMPRWASRITLEITDVRVERLHEITEDDAYAEGIEFDAWDQAPVTKKYDEKDAWFQAWDESMPNYVPAIDQLARASYRSLWESLNGAGSWALNPLVWVVSFRRLP